MIMYGSLENLLALTKEFFLNYGIEIGTVEMLSGLIALMSLSIIVVKAIIKGIKYIIDKRKNKILARDLHPFYTPGEIHKATKYYIKTNFQNVSPSEDDEPGRSYVAAAKQPLIPLFISKVFGNPTNDHKYYLILADSGMGKTTFMINLYLSYKFHKRWFWQLSKYDIKLFPLGNKETYERIKKMETSEKENTILLLDAFDEDNDAVIDYEKRMTELINMVWEFRYVVITCRTQFFPSSKSEPTETGKFKFGPDSGSYHFQKLYVSIFSQSDIKKYLKKRFKPFLFFKQKNYKKGLEIVAKSPNLMMRPMLLSHIEDLISEDITIEYSFQIYEILIEKWLERESDKPGIIEKYGSDYKKLLEDFSKSLARHLYKRRVEDGEQFKLNVNEIIDNPDGLQLEDIEGNIVNIEKYDQGSRSLLNRNALGEYKFSHKSVLEYFLAYEAIHNLSFRKEFQLDADLDATKMFIMEMIKSHKYKIEGLSAFTLLDFNLSVAEIISLVRSSPRLKNLTGVFASDAYFEDYRNDILINFINDGSDCVSVEEEFSYVIRAKKGYVAEFESKLNLRGKADMVTMFQILRCVINGQNKEIKEGIDFMTSSDSNQLHSMFKITPKLNFKSESKLEGDCFLSMNTIKIYSLRENPKALNLEFNTIVNKLNLKISYPKTIGIEIDTSSLNKDLFINKKDGMHASSLYIEYDHAMLTGSGIHLKMKDLREKNL